MKRKPPDSNVRRVRALGGNFRGVTTNKCGRLVQFESEQERKLILLLERDPTVIDFISQPERLDYFDGEGHARHYTPDFKVWHVGGQIELHEVTIASRRQLRAAIQLREAAAMEICRRRDWRYVVHTEQTLPAGQYYANLDFLSAFRGCKHITAEGRRWWWSHLAGCTCVHPAEVLAQHKSDIEPGIDLGVLLNGLYHLLWHARIRMDWHQPLIWRGEFHTNARIWMDAATDMVMDARAISAQDSEARA